MSAPDSPGGTLVPFTPGPRPAGPAEPAAPYAELAATSNFSFLHAGSHPAELVETAARLGLSGLGLCDRNSLAGAVRGHVAARELAAQFPGFRYVVGVRLCFADGTPDILAYPADRAAYGRLCRLLTRANARGEKGAPRLLFSDLAGPNDFARGQLFVLMPREDDWAGTEAALAALLALAPGRTWVAAVARFGGADRARIARIADLARRCRAPLLAANDVLYHAPERRMVQDVVRCIREGLTLEAAGRRLEAHAERHLKPAAEMARLFAEYPEALAETQRLLARIGFSLDQLRYNYPEETIGNGETAQQTLERLTWEGAARRFPRGVPEKVKRLVWSELCLIGYKRYAAYFLTVHDIVDYARNTRRILCQGRGSAANSTVCFCLGITEVNPLDAELVFGRFISTERDEPPDIDVDFEHERREEVMAYVYARYGGQRTGLVANVITYRSKSALREAARVFGLSEDVIAALNQMHWGWGSRIELSGVAEIGLDPRDPALGHLFAVVAVLRGFPRHLSQHVGGFVITRDSLETLVPIGKTGMESRTIIEWNKDDIDALGILKVDILALGMLSCLRRAFDLMRVHYGKHIELSHLLEMEKFCPERAAPVYAMTHRADTLGVFQIESRAQMTMLPRLKPRTFYDLVIEVAIVRPGPIQGGMVHPYLRRRLGHEQPVYPSPELEAVLERTLGVPLFQEQAMQIAIVGAGFTPGEADQLRRAMATWKRNGRIERFRDKFVSGMLERGHDPGFAEQCFRQIEGFGEYGFPESHAASFALLVYASCWLKCHYPDVFAAALLNSQPMGFYPSAQIIRDAIEHGVEMRAVDINRSDLEAVLEPGTGRAADRVAPRHAEMRPVIFSDKAVRLGLVSIKGLKRDHATILLARRGRGYDSVRDVWLRTRLPVATLETLAEADAFASLGLDRRAALWAVKGLAGGAAGAQMLPLFAAAGPAGPQSEHESEPDAGLPPMPPGEEVIHDYRRLTFSLKGHPVRFVRAALARRGILTAEALDTARDGAVVEVAGLVLVRQRPGTASGVIFATLEDETGIANAVVWPKTFEAHRRTLLAARLLAVRGKVQRDGAVVHLIARRLLDLTPLLIAIADGRKIGEIRPAPSGLPERGETYTALPSGRNFH